MCLGVDILFINGFSFLTTVSWHLYFTTVEAILNVEANTLLKALKGEFRHYHKCSFNIQMVMAVGGLVVCRYTPNGVGDGFDSFPSKLVGYKPHS